MKAFTDCPVCKVPLDNQWGNENLKSNQHDNCPIQFSVMTNSEFDGENGWYFHFQTKTFKIYYYPPGDSMWPNHTYFYMRSSVRENQPINSAIFIVKFLKIDFQKLDELDEKFRQRIILL